MFLESKKIVHRDLAARNVLVGNGGLVSRTIGRRACEGERERAKTGTKEELLGDASEIQVRDGRRLFRKRPGC